MSSTCSPSHRFPCAPTCSGSSNCRSWRSTTPNASWPNTPEGRAEMAYQAKFRVWRGDADGGQLVDFTVEVNEGEVVLDVIHRLQATQCGDLAVRWNCKAGKCGSCSAEINGMPGLMCMTRMSTFTEDETITVTPIRSFPVLRDLVTDVSYNYVK